MIIARKADAKSDAGELRETIVAVDILGLSYKEGARALGTGEGTIMSRLYSARLKVGESLEGASR